MKVFRSKWSALFLSNFLGVLNDNLLKNCIIFTAIAWQRPSWMIQSQLIAVVSACLVVPYLFFSPLSGKLAIIYSKQKIYSLFKLLEIPIMVVACVAFYFQSIGLAIASILIMGIYSCLYSPSKYGLIRDIGGDKGISFGSAVFEMLVFLGILLGTVLGSVLSEIDTHYSIVISLFIGFALLGYFISKIIHVKELPVDKPQITTMNPILFFFYSIKQAKQYEFVNSGVFGAAVFWLIGGMIQMNLIIHCQNIYHTSNSVTGLIMASAAIGIALGCWTVGKISGPEVKIGLILIGIIGMSLLLFILTVIKVPLVVFVILVFSVAFLGGIFQIPCLALVQNKKLGRKVGDMIAFLNFSTFAFVLLGTLLFSMTTKLFSENSFVVFGLITIISIFVTLYYLIISPHFWQETKRIFSK